jgi:hypothetical protein
MLILVERVAIETILFAAMTIFAMCIGVNIKDIPNKKYSKFEHACEIIAFGVLMSLCAVGAIFIAGGLR